MRLLRIPFSLLAVWIAVFAGMPAQAQAPGEAVSLVRCGTDVPGSSLRRSDASTCSLSADGPTSNGNLVPTPTPVLSGQVSAPGFPINGVSAFVTATLDYEFQVSGGVAGTVVPVLIATNLFTQGSGSVHGWGFASLSIDNVFGQGASAVACTSGSGCGALESFHGTLGVQVRSGGQSGGVHLQISAFAGSSPFDRAASATADPFISIDPSFADADLYTGNVSPGIGNAPAVPEPANAALWLAGLALMGRLVRRRSGA